MCTKGGITITTFWKNFLIGMIISVLAFTVIAKFGVDFIVDTVSASFLDKEDEDDNVIDDNKDNNTVREDFSVTGTYSFAIFVTQNTYLPDYVPAFDGYTYDSILETYEIQYAQNLRYIVVVTIDSANKQFLIDTMVGNLLIPYNNVSVPLDYIYYLVRTGTKDVDYEYLADFAGTYTGLTIDNYFFVSLDRFCDITNYTDNAQINIPENFTGTHPYTSSKVNVSAGKQALSYELLHMMMNHDGYLNYSGVCNSVSDVFSVYLKSILRKDQQNSAKSLIDRWNQITKTDITINAVKEKLNLIFSVSGYESFNVVPGATLKKYADKYYYVINVNESITNIKKYYYKASS